MVVAGRFVVGGRIVEVRRHNGVVEYSARGILRTSERMCADAAEEELRWQAGHCAAHHRGRVSRIQRLAGTSRHGVRILRAWARLFVDPLLRCHAVIGSMPRSPGARGAGGRAGSAEWAW